MRDYLLTAFVAVLVPIAFVRPWIGVLGWYWIGFMNPHRLTWDFAYTLPFAAAVGLATLAGALFARDRRSIPMTPEMVLTIVLLAYFAFTTLFAWAPNQAWAQLVKVAKIIVMTLVATMFIYGRERIRWLLLVAALSIGFYGFKGGIWSILTGGAEQVLGPEKSFIEGNTFMGLALNMVIPVIVALGLEEPRRWLRRLLYLTAALCVVASVFTYSRGAWLGLLMILPLVVWQFGAKLRVLLGVVLVATLATAPLFMPDRFLTRWDTLQNYEQDCSSNQRFMSWTVHWNIAKTYPITGAGFELEWAQDGRYLSFGDAAYAHCFRNAESSAAHNIVLQVVGQHGMVAGGLYVALLGYVLLRLWRLRAEARTDSRTRWISTYAYGLLAGYFGYVVTGMFLSSAYFDLPWLYVAVCAILGRELAESRRAPEGGPARQTVATGALDERRHRAAGI